MSRPGFPRGGVTAFGLFAHSGGWDEALFVLVPIGLFGGLLAISNKRAQAAEQEQERRGQATLLPEPDDPAGAPAKGPST
jgi:hypothetical protein